MTNTISKKLTAGLLALMVAFTFMPVLDTANAAATPAKVKISKIAKSQTKIATTWKKAKNAKKYEFQIKRPYKVWYKYKLVKKTAKNKKKFTKKNLYKVKSSGKKYQVYKYAVAYVTTTTAKTKVTVKNLQREKTYKIRVRGINGRTKGSWSKVATVKTDAIPAITDINNTKFVEGNKYKYTNTEGMNTIITIDCVADGETYGKTSAGGDFYKDSTGTCIIDNIGPSKLEMNWSYDNDLQSDIYQLIIKDAGITAYWTIDGTEPQKGQADLTGKTQHALFPKGETKQERIINGDKGIYDPNYVTQIRGTISGKGTHGFLCGDSLVHKRAKKTRIIWVKAYKNDKLVYDSKSVWKY